MWRKLEQILYLFDAKEDCCAEEGGWDCDPSTLLPEHKGEEEVPDHKDP